MPAKLDITLRFRLDTEVERRLGHLLDPQNVPTSCYVSADERRVLAAKLAAAKAAQLVVVEQIVQQGGHLFAGHDWRVQSRSSCMCPACIISRAEEMFDELSEMVRD